MSPIAKNHEGRRRSWHGLKAVLAGLGWLALSSGATAQVAVDTIGGGVREECESASGFLSGNTYEDAQFNAPFSCALDTNGNLWIADKNNNDLEQVSEAGDKVDSITTEYYSLSGTAPHYVTNYHYFTNITAVAVDPANNLYVLLPSPPQVYKCSLTVESANLNVVSALFLSNTPAGALPSAMTVDGSSNVFLAFTNGVIIRFPLLDSNPPPTVYAENYGLGASTGVHYVVTNFPWRPSGLALRADGQLAVSDTLSNAIYVVSTNDYNSNTGPHLVTGGKGPDNGMGYDDGAPSFAKFDQPYGLAATADGHLIVCDTMNNRLRVIDTFSNTTTLYGTDSNVWTATCCSCDPTLYAGWVDGVAGITTTNASGREPVSVVISPSGSLFVTELYYSLIRQVNNVSYTPVVLNATLPLAVTEAATSINSSNATFNGTINACAEDTTYYFQWGTTNNYTNFTATNLLTANLTNTINVSATVSNLLPSTTYYFLLVAYNSLGYSINTNYLSAVIPAEQAVVVTLPATSVTASSATLNATVNPENSPAQVYFQWGSTSNYGNSTTPINLSNNLLNTANLSTTISNLEAGTIYYYQAVAFNAGGYSTGAELTAVTPPALPVVDTQTANATSPSNATVFGTIIANDETASYYFEWGLTTNYGNFFSPSQLTNNGAGPQTAEGLIANLLPGTEYHFQLVAFNNVGIGYGGDVTAMTPAAPAFVVTLPATSVTNTSAILNATVNPANSPTEVYFQWGTTSNFGNYTTPVNLTTNLTNTLAVSAAISNLQPNTIYFFQAVAYNSGGTVAGSELIFNTPYLPPPTLSFSPNSGYFPSCVTIYVTSSVQTVYYTTNGTTPTTNSTAVFLPISLGLGTNVGSFQWCNSQQSLAALEVLAGNGSNTTVLQGSYSVTNSVGFPEPLSGGPGDHVYVPVVVDLQNGVPLQSLQFRVEITPDDTNAPMIEAIDLQPLTPDDLVPLPGPAPGDTPVAFDTFAYTTSSNGQGLVITASGGSSGLNMQNSGVVVMLHFEIPTNAPYGENYSLSVLDPSGTSDGQQGTVGLATLTNQILTISDPPYLVGDSSPSTGYNAGQFGNGELDNADVNNAIYASVGIRVPPSDSDLYNAMDAWPPDSAGRGGDGFIRLLDWETILARSVGGIAVYPGLDTNNYIRFWTNGDSGYPSHAIVDWYPGGPAVPLSLDGTTTPAGSGAEKLSVTNSPPGLVWFCEASIGAGTIINALPGSTYSLPVYVRVSPGYSLAGLQFRSIVTGSSGAPVVTSNWFTPAAGLTTPLILPGLAGNDQVQAWSFGSFATPLQNSNYLGTVSFKVPSGAGQGACYALHFSGVDGAPNYSTAYQLESHPGYVWVMSAAQQTASITSDEWKIAFFGSLTNSLAGDNVDADGDGAANWQEYLAGTNPTNALSRLQFSSANLSTGGLRGVAINWLTAPGKTYILQSSPALSGANWTPINTNSGDGNEYECLVTNLSGNSHFYQILLQP